jgi:hypothetical protein
MADKDLLREMQQSEKEPLLPVEKKLIVGSISLGFVLLVVLAVISHLFVPGR